MICRCPIEFYGAKCQHQRFALPSKPEFLTVVANFNEIIIKWLPIFEDSSSNTVIESLKVSIGSDVYSISDFNSNQLKKSIAPDTEVELKIHVIYKNGIMAESEVYNIRSAPELQKPEILERLSNIVKMKFGDDSLVERYTVMRTYKKRIGKDRYSAPIFEGRSGEMNVVPQIAFPSGRDVTLAIQGQTEFGLTNIKEVTIRIKHAAPLFIAEKIKVGITKVELYWKQEMDEEDASVSMLS
ncbi:Oidioi.mRNA.OKI2018_I69.chrUn_2.g17231.t1.cds [Oikopleura dioica]|uniref:Oidioi.mRNA.OKI2018_I69.chrUn_2.g17231.t1.c ds n=1 Tax=Oikopleura dioica TaxID=34765 RepID=A0ABN7TDW4_OIKDI|nr:Oidioi.mRNA.OKI2018_I69.chrUn_2.g17231.t1.cds [Oikopleura dioica]